MNEQTAPRHDAVFPLALARTGEMVVIAAIRGGKDLNRKLMERGLRPGVHLKVMQKKAGGFVLGRDSQRIALGSGMVQKLFVSLPGSGNEGELT